MAKTATFANTGESKITKTAAFITHAMKVYGRAMDSYGTAIIKVKAK
jgi:hypothetical protein